MGWTSDTCSSLGCYTKSAITCRLQMGDSTSIYLSPKPKWYMLASFTWNLIYPTFSIGINRHDHTVCVMKQTSVCYFLCLWNPKNLRIVDQLTLIQPELVVVVWVTWWQITKNVFVYGGVDFGVCGWGFGGRIVATWTNWSEHQLQLDCILGWGLRLGLWLWQRLILVGVTTQTGVGATSEADLWLGP